MTSELDFGARPLPERVVLLTLAHCVRRASSPVHTGQVMQACRDHHEALGRHALGRLGEADVNRALNRLEADGIVETASRDPSPTGKGRPVYRPVPSTDAVVQAARGDEQVADIVDALDSL